MDSKEKKELSEIDICDLFITPAFKEAGWDQLTQIRREVTLTPGPVVVRGNMSSRNKNKNIKESDPLIGPLDCIGWKLAVQTSRSGKPDR